MHLLGGGGPLPLEFGVLVLPAWSSLPVDKHLTKTNLYPAIHPTTRISHEYPPKEPNLVPPE